LGCGVRGSAGRRHARQRLTCCTQKQQATPKRGLSPGVADYCLRLCALVRPARPRKKRVSGSASCSIRVAHRVGALPGGRCLADSVPSHPQPSDSQRKRRCGEIRLIRRSKRRRRMRLRFVPPHHGHSSVLSSVSGSMRSARLVRAATTVSPVRTLRRTGAIRTEFSRKGMVSGPARSNRQQPGDVAKVVD